jgi:nucleotide-binding universal stress UspA family protein
MRRRVILVPMDFSPASERALTWAAEVAQRTGRTLHVLHVVPRLHQLDPFFHAGFLPSETLKRIRGRAAGRVARLLRRRVPYQLTVDEGDPTPTILARIEQLRPQLVVVGTHARRGAERLLLGSVAEKIIRASQVPVVAIRSARSA